MVESLDAAVAWRTLELPGLRMNVGEAGSGEPALLLHGFPQSSREWTRVIPHLAGSARVIVPDLRGAGLTDAPAGRYDLTALRGDLVAMLDELELERAALVAHDWSALVAFSLALEHPERVSRLVVLSTPPPYLRMHPSMVGSMPYLWFQYALAMPGLGGRLLAGGRQRLPRWILRTFTARGIPDDDVAAYLATLRAPDRARAGSALYRHLIVPEFLRIIAGRYRGRILTTPTLILFGDEDRVIPKAALHGFEQDAPGLRIEFVPGGAHFLVDDAPDEVAARVRGFLGLSAA